MTSASPLRFAFNTNGAANHRLEDAVALIADAGYDGIVTFESFSSEVVHPTLSNALAIWRNLWTDNDALARDALAFTKAGLQR